MLSNEERNLLVKTYQEMPDARKLSKIYGVSVSSVYRLVRQMNDEGCADLRTGSRGRKPSLSPEDIENIRKAIEEQPDITIHEINAKLGLSVNDETIRLKVVAPGLRYKKTLRASERERPDIREERERRRKWQENIMRPALRRLVFLDESGVNTNLTRLYGRAFGGERVIDRVP